MERSDYFVRAWHTELAVHKAAGGITTSNQHVYCVLMDGAIIQMGKETGVVLRSICPNFSVANACGIAFALNRFVVVDSHRIKVIDVYVCMHISIYIYIYVYIYIYIYI